jgi:hypothetical protein
MGSNEILLLMCIELRHRYPSEMMQRTRESAIKNLLNHELITGDSSTCMGFVPTEKGKRVVDGIIKNALMLSDDYSELLRALQMVEI